MLRADLMPRSDYTALQKGEGRFDGVRVNVTDNVDAEFVHDALVVFDVSCPRRRSSILVHVIGHQHFNIVRDVFPDVPLKGSRTHVIGMEETKLSAALTDSNHNLFIRRSATALPVRPTANIGFIHFDHAIQRLALCLNHCRANPMAEIPSGFVRLDSERTLNLASRNTFLRFTQEQDSEKPNRERQVRVVEDRVHGHAELVAA